LEQNPADLTLDRAALSSEMQNAKNMKDYSNRTLDLMNSLIQNPDTLGDPKKLANTIATKILSDNVSRSLFNAGDDRGQDAITLRRIASNAVFQLEKENPGSNLSDAFKTENATHLKNLIDQMSKTTYNKTNYTTAGLVTGGIKLKQDIDQDRVLVNDFKNQIQEVCGAVRLNNNELSEVNKIAEGVSNNLFGNKSSQEKTNASTIISGVVKNAMTQVKIESGSNDITPYIKNQSNIIGTINRGWGIQKPTCTGLTDTFYQNSKYTATGSISGAIYLPEELKGSNFIDLIKNQLQEQIPDLAARKTPSKNLGLKEEGKFSNFIKESNNNKPLNILPSSSKGRTNNDLIR
jgi:hypothetical protein